MRVRIKIDDRSVWWRRSILGANISNGNWIIALIFSLACGGAIYTEWIWVGVGLGVASLLSIVWNESVAKTATIVGTWIAAGVASAWLLGMLCDSMFGNPPIGHALGLVIGVVGVIKTID